MAQCNKTACRAPVIVVNLGNAVMRIDEKTLVEAIMGADAYGIVTLDLVDLDHDGAHCAGRDQETAEQADTI